MTAATWSVTICRAQEISMFALYCVSQKSSLTWWPLMPPAALMSLIAASTPALRSPSGRIGLLTEIALPTVIVELLELADPPPAAAELELFELLPHAASSNAVAATATEHAIVRLSL